MILNEKKSSFARSKLNKRNDKVRVIKSNVESKYNDF